MTKADLAAEGARRDELAAAVDALLARTILAGVPVLFASAHTGEGIDEVRGALGALAVDAAERSGRARLAIDRVFAVRGRGTVVTGSLRGGPVAPGDTLRLVPGDRDVRIREVQVRSATVETATGGRTALLLGGVEAGDIERGAVLTADADVVGTSGSSSRSGVRRGSPLEPRHPCPSTAIGSGCTSGPTRSTRSSSAARARRSTFRTGASLAILRLTRPIAAAAGDRFALRQPSPGSTAGGGVVLDPLPPRGISRRRLTPERAAALAAGDPAARLDVHGALVEGDAVRLAPDVAASLRQAAIDAVRAHHAAEPSSPGLALPALRTTLAIRARRLATLDRTAAEQVARHVVDQAIADGALARDGDRLRDPGRAAGLPPDVLAAMDRLEAALAVAAPPSLSAAARDAGCPPDGVKALERDKRIVRLEDDLAWATTTWQDLTRRALELAAKAPLTPAAFRDETGTSRRYVLVLLEDLDRRGILRRTDAGHVIGPKTLERMRAHVAATADAP